MDMMSNTSIIYHMESVLEMQILALVTCFLLSKNWAEKQEYGKKDD